MSKGSYTKVRELITPKISEDNKTLVAICQKLLPRVPVRQIKQYVGRAAWELRRKLEQGQRNQGVNTKTSRTRSGSKSPTSSRKPKAEVITNTKGK